MSHQDDVLRLEQDFAEAVQRLYSVGNGLARLRVALGESGPPHAVPATPTAPGHPTGPPPTAVPVTVPSASSAPSAASGPSAWSGTSGTPALSPPAPHPAATLPVPEPWYRREGAVTRVLGVAGALVTLAGVAMLLVVAVRHGWFGPEARVASGALLAVVLGALGARGGARDRARGSAVGAGPVALVATGAAAAYLDVVALTTVYGWVPGVLGLALCVLVATLGLSLARTWASEPLAVLTVVGAAAFSPVVAGAAGWVLSGVLAVLAGVGWWAAGDRPAPRLTVVRTAPVALSLLAGAVTVEDRSGLLALLAVAAAVLGGTLVASAVTVRRHVGDVASTVAVVLGAAGVLAVAAAQADPTRTTAFALLAATLLLAATTYGRRPVGPLPAHLVATTAGAGAVSAVLAVLSGAPSRFVGTGLVLLALGHVAVGGMTRSRLSLGVGAGVSVVAVLAWSGHAAATTSPWLAERHDLAVAFVDSALLGGLAALASWAAQAVRRVPQPVRRATRVAATALGLLAGATALVSLGTLAGRATGDPVLGFTVGHALATVGWLLVAAALLLHSLEHRSDLALRSGLALAAVALTKLFLFDLSSLDGIVRSAAFIVAGLVLLATGSRYARAWERRAGA